MYTAAGDEALNLVLSQYTKRAAPIKKSEVEGIIEQIANQVVEMGKGKVHNTKYGGDPWEGFSEVWDTSVRETLYIILMDKAVEG